MGENVLEYNGVLFDEDDSYSEREDECSLSEDDFLEIPFNDRTVCKHWLYINYDDDISSCLKKGFWLRTMYIKKYIW